MEFPVAFVLGPLKLPAHLVFETLAFVSGFRYYLYLRAHTTDPIREENRSWIFIGAAAGAFLGSRLSGAFEVPAALRSAANPFLHVFASKSIVGGLLGGLAGVEGIKKWIGETRSSGDLFTFPLILGIMIGRIGCFLNGIHEPTYGLATTWITGMNLGDGISRHPVTLYEFFFLALLWTALAITRKKITLPDGVQFKLFVIAYLGFRFLLEFLKPRVPVLAGLGTLQIWCLAGLVYYRVMLRMLILHPTRFRTYGQ